MCRTIACQLTGADHDGQQGEQGPDGDQAQRAVHGVFEIHGAVVVHHARHLNPDAIKHHHAVVDGVGKDGQHRRHKRQVDDVLAHGEAADREDASRSHADKTGEGIEDAETQEQEDCHHDGRHNQRDDGLAGLLLGERGVNRVGVVDNGGGGEELQQRELRCGISGSVIGVFKCTKTCARVVY